MKINVAFCYEYFNRINFREIKFRDFANFRPFREIKTREIVWHRSFAKLNPREIVIVFLVKFIKKSAWKIHVQRK